ncbi:MAG: DUF4465 domain-containing protein [Kiritimatiellales bacterium]|jgi:hypothetical protein
MRKTTTLCALLTAAAGCVAASTATIDTKNTGVNHYYRPDTVGNHDWTDAGATFNLSVVDDGWGGTSWGGFTYSDVDDTATSGYGNQFAVYGSGKDYSGNGVYGIGYIDAWNAINPTVSFASAVTVNGFFANNTTYAALDMLNGSGFSKQFTTNDWFKLTIEGFDSGSASLGTVDFNLADFSGYTDGANRQDYIVTNWMWVDLTVLGNNVSSLKFSLSSSDSGAFGMNTPAYFAIDNVQAVPEPASVMLVMLGGLGIAGYRRLRAGYGMR